MPSKLLIDGFNKLKIAYNDTRDENEVDEVVRKACKDTPELLLDAAAKQSRDEAMNALLRSSDDRCRLLASYC